MAKAGKQRAAKKAPHPKPAQRAARSSVSKSAERAKPKLRKAAAAKAARSAPNAFKLKAVKRASGSVRKSARRTAPKAGRARKAAAPARAGQAAPKPPQPKGAMPARTAAPAGPTRPIKAPLAPAVPGQPELRVGDEAVKKATGRNWAAWCQALDAAGAQTLPHSDIARLVFERFRVGPWWAQMVTVGYEQARGLRVAHQRPDGFSVSATKTLAAGTERVYAAWNVDAERNRWLGTNLKVRSATPPKSIRLAGSDGLSQIVVMLHAKGAKTQVAVEHNKLKDTAEVARMKSYWKSALERLRSAVEGS
jgi:hypothetical protein